MYLFTTVPHPHGHWQLQELFGKGSSSIQTETNTRLYVQHNGVQKHAIDCQKKRCAADQGCITGVCRPCLSTNGFIIADISVRSLRTLCIFIIKKSIFLDQSIQKNSLMNFE